MNEQKETKSMPNQFILTPEQKLALVEAKVKRAKAHIKALAEIAKKLNSVWAPSVNRKRGPVLHYKQAQTGGGEDGLSSCR